MKSNIVKAIVCVVPVILWVLNLGTAIIQHLHAGPGKVIPTPFQRFLALSLAPQYGPKDAVHLANSIFVWISVGVLVLMVVYIFTERSRILPSGGPPSLTRQTL